MKPAEYVADLNVHLSHLYSFARQMNELDFAASLGGEFRGMQDAGWATTVTAHQVFEEFAALYKSKQPASRMRLRHVLMLYCQLAEAGGFYETLKNLLGVVTLKPYLLWPFKDLVRVRDVPKRIIGPNANATFRNLAANAESIGLVRLSELLELAFRDDIRNGISHADYVIWEDGLRLRKRNGGHAELLSFDDLNEALSRGVNFFQLLNEYNARSVRLFDPPRTIVGRFSANFPMPWTVSFNSVTRAFSLSGSSPGPVADFAFIRQCEINGRLGGKVMTTFSHAHSERVRELESHILSKGFEPNKVVLDETGMTALLGDVERLNLWDSRTSRRPECDLLVVTPWGFRWVESFADFDALLGQPSIEVAADGKESTDTRQGPGDLDPQNPL